jgi:hypothetical protein
MAEEQARTRAGFDALPGPFPSDPPPIPTSWELPPPHNPPAQCQPHLDALTAPAPPGYPSTSDIAILHLRLPNLTALSDDMFRHTPLTTLLALNSESKEPGDLGAAAAHAAAAAAHLLACPRESNPGIKIAKALESLRSHSVILPTAADDRVELLHPACFLRGTVCSSKKIWLAAHDIIGLEVVVVPLSSYDMATVGLGGVRHQPWVG